MTTAGRPPAASGQTSEEEPPMSADQAQILAEIAGMLRTISDSLLPGEEITRDTRLLDDLELQSIGLARLAGRLQARYGAGANLVPLLTRREEPLSSLQVGELVEYIARVLDGDGETARPARLAAMAGPGRGSSPELPWRPAGDGAGLDAPGVDAPGLLGGFLLATDGHRPRNDNLAVLSELAPGTSRTLLDLPGGAVEVFTAGDGPPLVLMHPINLGAGVFARQFARLAGQYRLVCLHHPGVGATTWDADLTLGGLAQLHRAALAGLAIQPPFHLLGASFGGLVAQQFALLYPAECASLSLAGSTYRIGGTPGVRRPLPLTVAEELDLIAALDGSPASEGDRAGLEDLLLRCESMDTRTGLAYLSTLARARPTLLPQLPGIVTPTLIIHGRLDTVVPAKHAHLLYGAIPDARLHELETGGHFPWLTHPARVGRLLEPFLAAHPAAPAAPAPSPARAAAGWTAAPPGRARVSATAVATTTAAGDTAPPPALSPGLERCIIISSGRCGSTMLSNLIADEPGTLSVYEALTTLRRHLLLMPETPITAAEFWRLMSDPGPQGAASARIGSVPDEACYPSTGRWAADPRGVPPILYCTLPRMSADPDQLFDLLADQVREFPAQPVTQHLWMMLDLLAAMAGRQRWVERSGGSSAVAEPLLRALPGLRVVYLTRDIPDTARSMSRHPTFQFAAARYEFQIRFGIDPYSPWLDPDHLPDPAGLPEEMQRLLPDRITMAALTDLGRDVSRYEAMCAHMMGSAEQALADIRPRHLHRMRYEDVLADPARELRKLGDFLGFADPAGWAAATAGRVRPPRARSAQPT